MRPLSINGTSVTHFIVMFTAITSGIGVFSKIYCNMHCLLLLTLLCQSCLFFFFFFCRAGPYLPFQVSYLTNYCHLNCNLFVTAQCFLYNFLSLFVYLISYCLIHFCFSFYNQFLLCVSCCLLTCVFDSVLF